MRTYDWKPFLAQWRRELFRLRTEGIKADQADVRPLPTEAVTSRGLGYAGTTEDQIAPLESR